MDFTNNFTKDFTTVFTIDFTQDLCILYRLRTGQILIKYFSHTAQNLVKNSSNNVGSFAIFKQELETNN